MSKNLVGAGNQQERLSSEEKELWFLAGLVEGEGSVTISTKTHPNRRFGCYVQPEFFIYQHKSRRRLLERAAEYFECGRIRAKPGNPDVLVFGIIARREIVRCVIPFLQTCKEMTERWDDFEKFIAVVTLLEAGMQATPDGLRLIIELAYSMNMGGKQRRTPMHVILDRIPRGHMPNAQAA